MTDTNETQVEVTQADRDAAAGYEKKYPAEDNPFAFEMERGDADSTPLVQAFARHRIQAEKRNNALAVELREAAKNTTPETWHVVPYGDGDSLVICMDETGNRRIAFMATPGCRDHVARKRSWAEIKANAALIVALRNNLPAILAALEGDE